MLSGPRVNHRRHTFWAPAAGSVPLAPVRKRPMLATSTTPAFGAAGPDPHGQAALLLVESLVHALIDNCVMTVRDAVTTVEIARDAQVGLAEADRSPAATTQLLEAVLHSLQHDLPPDGLHA